MCEGHRFKVRMLSLFMFINKLNNVKVEKIDNDYYLDFNVIVKALISKAYADDAAAKAITKEVDSDLKKSRKNKRDEMLKASSMAKKKFAGGHSHSTNE
jgi:hypothetical protein